MKGFIQVSLLVPCTLSENCFCKYCILVAPGQLFADLRQWNDAPLHIIPSQDFKIVKTSEQRDWQCFRQNQINCYWNNVIATNHRQSEFLGTIFAAFQILQLNSIISREVSIFKMSKKLVVLLAIFSCTYGADQYKPMPDKRYIVRRGELFQDVDLQSSDTR